MEGMRSVVLFMSVEVAGPESPDPCIEPIDEVLDLKTFLQMRFISLMIKIKERSLDYVSRWRLTFSKTRHLTSTCNTGGTEVRSITVNDAFIQGLVTPFIYL